MILKVAVPVFCRDALLTSSLFLSLFISSKFLLPLRYPGVDVSPFVLIFVDRHRESVIFPSLVEPATEVSLILQWLEIEFIFKPVLQLQSFLVL